MQLTVTPEAFPISGAFVISGRGEAQPWVRTEAEVLSVAIRRDGITGRGECTPYPRYGESLQSVEAEIRKVEPWLATRPDRDALLELMPAGAARNALDCALWDWEAKSAGKRAWVLAGLPDPQPVSTTYTLSLQDPETMREKAASFADWPLLKIKLGGEGDMARLEAVREGAPRTRIIVDANEGWSVEEYTELAPALLRLGVAMVEQPLPAASDAALAEIERPLPVCADESCHDRATLPGLKGRYDYVNIKLDKTGGLTEALALRDAARGEGYKIMVGCMMGSSLAVAPAVMLAQGAQIVDLDAPLLLAEDRDVPLRYSNSEVEPPEAELWG